MEYNLSIEIIVNLLIALFAFLAWKQSVKARCYTSFEVLFTQLISLLKSFFDNKYLSRTLLKADEKKDNIQQCIELELYGQKYKYIVDEDLPTTLSFTQYFIYISQLQNNRALDIYHIIKIWDSFRRRLVYKEYFDNSFKFIYNIIRSIENAKIDDAEKNEYKERVQALLNKNELFCYFINLIVFYKGNEHEYLEKMRGCRFFRDLLVSKDFEPMIKNCIPNEIIKLFM